MGKIALLVSREEMLHQAHNILQEPDGECGDRSQTLDCGRGFDQHCARTSGVVNQAVHGYSGCRDCADRSGDGAPCDEGKTDRQKAKTGDRGCGISEYVL